MSGAGFTKGPWLVHAERRWIVPAEDAFKEPLDALPICQLRDPDERLTEDETLANGFLIAAAPALYDALLCASGSIDHAVNCRARYGGECHCGQRALCEQIDAALSAARGEQ